MREEQGKTGSVRKEKVRKDLEKVICMTQEVNHRDSVGI